MKTGIELISEERTRQIEIEGWDKSHDDEHSDGSLVKASICYATGCPTEWPWEPNWWKPSPEDRVKELVKAGALIAAEIDRINK